MGNSKLTKIDEQITAEMEKFQKLRERKCYPFLLLSANISTQVVEDVFDDLRKDYCDCDEKLDVVIFSGGGSIDAAYNLSALFRRYASNELTFIVPRWAKSAATLLACSGDKILMSPIAELGPLDPQITEVNPLEQRIEQFSPLHIGATLDLIRSEFENGHKDLANGLLNRLQFPLTLGAFKKSIDLSKEYLRKLLSTRMLNGADNAKKVEEITKKLTEGYPDHSFCINLEEAKAIGLTTEELQGEELNVIWGVHKLTKEKEKIISQQKKKKIEELMKKLPPGFGDVPPESINKTKPKGLIPQQDFPKQEIE